MRRRPSGLGHHPSAEHDFPYGVGSLEGFQGRTVDEAVRAALQRPMIVLLGDADTDTMQDNLRRTPEANAQGPHRFARGNTYFETAQREAARLGVPFAWRIHVVLGVGHSNTLMAPGVEAPTSSSSTWRRG